MKLNKRENTQIYNIELDLKTIVRLSTDWEIHMIAYETCSEKTSLILSN